MLFIKAKIIYLKFKAKQSFKNLENVKKSIRQSHILGGADSALESLVGRDTAHQKDAFIKNMNRIRMQKNKLN